MQYSDDSMLMSEDAFLILQTLQFQQSKFQQS